MRSRPKALYVTVLLSGTLFLPMAHGSTLSLDGDWNLLADPEGKFHVPDLASAGATCHLEATPATLQGDNEADPADNSRG